MSLTVLCSNSWQPSVLHLLPFSSNDAGATPRRKSSGSAPLRHGNDASRDFPVLAVTRSEEKARSKSAVASSTGSSHGNTLTKAANGMNPRGLTRLQRSSSEKLSRARGADGTVTFAPRAKSEYGVQPDKKKHVKVSISDINSQILKKEPNDLTASSPDSGNYRTDKPDSKIRPLPKPALKNPEGRWPVSNVRFWRSSTTSPGEVELKKHKLSAELQIGQQTQRAQRLKLNVKDIPRSKTPISENDPDKLNMKHVIAFLQTSAKTKPEENENEDTTQDNSRDDLENNPPTPREGEDRLSQGQSVVSVGTNGIVVRRHGFNDRNHPQTDTHKTANTTKTTSSFPENLSFRASTRPKSFHSTEVARKSNSESTGRLKLDERYELVETRRRPTSLHEIRGAKDSLIPENIRKIREQKHANKPFRLHRFLTLVPKGSDALLNGDGADTKLTRSDRDKARTREASRSVTNLDRGHTHQPTRSHSETRYYYLSGSPPHSKPRRHRNDGDCRDLNLSEPSEHIGSNLHQVICLPTVPLDVDSDEEGGSAGTTLPTIHGNRNGKMFAMSMHGRSVKERKFPSRVLDSTTKQAETSGVPAVFHSRSRPSSFNSDTTQRPRKARDTKKVRADEIHAKMNPHVLKVAKPEESPEIVIKSGSKEVVVEPAQEGTPVESVPSNADSPWGRSNVESAGGVSETFITLFNEQSDVVVPSQSQQAEDSTQFSETRSKKALKSPTEHVKLSLRKERNQTRETTYMLDMRTSGGDGGGGGGCDGVRSGGSGVGSSSVNVGVGGSGRRGSDSLSLDGVAASSTSGVTGGDGNGSITSSGNDRKILVSGDGGDGDGGAGVNGSEGDSGVNGDGGEGGVNGNGSDTGDII